MKKIIIAAAVALLATGAAQAQSQALTGFYGDIGYTFVKVKDDNVAPSFKPGAIRAFVGYDLHPNVAVEAMLAGGAGDDTKQGVTVKISRSYGLFVKPKYAFNDQFEVFGRLGFADSKIKVSGGNAVATGKDNSFAWGVGAAYNFNKQVYGAVDYMSYFDKDSTKIDGVTLSVGYRF
ncbi:porin family protein [Roseateles chitosanitabidus]|uniref:porin family protein n=1 Tax=Roseateles chitosanitabidus TaxID=65048 RepID=UPI00082FD2AC|nr:porin family protein [Roseateles chitosanitabidus]MBO9689588.1 porin family protein [Roseateles chitosanitabidus]